MDRRDFLKLAGGTVLVGACGGRAAGPVAPDPGDAERLALAELALDAARSAGASYADVRIADYRRQNVATREARVTGIGDSEDRGFGVRVIVDGTWGFAASSQLDRAEVVRVARQAVELARALAVMTREPVVLAATPAHRGTWSTPIELDPFTVSVAEKIETLLAINAAALAVKGVSFCSSQLGIVREHKLFASSEGARIEQTLHRLDPSFTVTSVDRQRGSFQTRDSYASPQAMGYEYVLGYPWLDEARQAGEDAVAKHSAPSIEPGPRDLVLHPSHLWLTIHESIGHPTELDRALGLEANFAGTSFLTPDKLGTERIGSELVTLVAEKTSPGGLASCGYDDDGVATSSFTLVDRGVFVDYQTTRDQAHWIGQQASHGTSYAQSWRDVPFQRMPNVNLVPGPGPLAEADLIADTEDGIFIKGRGSYSIDHQRYNFQFGGQTFWKIERGRITGMLRDVAYQARTPEFWQACDAICDRSAYAVGGSFYDGKGEPGQANAVSHGCSTARFRKIAVLNTGRQV